MKFQPWLNICFLACIFLLLFITELQRQTIKIQGERITHQTQTLRNDIYRIKAALEHIKLSLSPELQTHIRREHGI